VFHCNYVTIVMISNILPYLQHKQLPVALISPSALAQHIM